MERVGATANLSQYTHHAKLKKQLRQDEWLKAYAKQEGFTFFIDERECFSVSGHLCITLDAVEAYMEGYLKAKRDTEQNS